MKNESVLDIPKQDLDSSVWTVQDGKYILTEEANNKILNVVKWVINKIGISNFILHITGSITSNQYSDKSDIDIHFVSSEIKDFDKINSVVRKEFNDTFLTNKEQITVGTHQIEIYFQENEFQDYMSIGCYDFFKKEWIVGPEFLPQNYDPYSEYFNKDMKYVNSVIEDIRNVILETFEILVVIRNSTDKDFIEYEYNTLKDKLAKAAMIFTQAREFRKVYSAPTSMEDALTKRSSKEWKIADSAFKLLDKFGYLGILREMTTAYQDLNSKKRTIEEIIPNIIAVIQNNIMSNPAIQNVDKQLFEDLQDESVASNLATILTIVSMIAIPGVTNAKSLEKELKNIPKQSFNIHNPAVTKAINKSAIEDQKFGGWSYSNLTNLIAILAYNEGMIDYIKPNANGEKYDNRVLQAIIWTVINRAGGDVNKFAEKILEPNQYFGVKNIKNRDASNYIIQHPGLGYNKKTWNQCNKFAIMAIKGTLPKPKDDNGVDFGTRNMIANQKIDNATSYKKWGSKCDFTLGGSTKHYYGYDKSHDGWPKNTQNQVVVKPNLRTYKIQSGDTLSKIAKKFNTTTEKILKNNPSIKDKDKIFIGKKIYV